LCRACNRIQRALVTPRVNDPNQLYDGWVEAESVVSTIGSNERNCIDCVSAERSHLVAQFPSEAPKPREYRVVSLVSAENPRLKGIEVEVSQGHLSLCL